MKKDDLISRVAAIDAIVSATAFQDAEYIKNLCQNPANSEDWLGGVCDAINAVEDVNAVDAAPVVHAKWIETVIPANTTGHGGVGQDKKKGWFCSNCKCAFDAVLLWCDSFCPNCGAHMDGERRDSK